MKCQILFSGKNKKSITNLVSAELAQRVVKVNTNSVDLDQMLHSVASDLGLYCSPSPFYGMPGINTVFDLITALCT